MARTCIHLIAHTHWDREWYLPLGGLRARLIGLVDELLDRYRSDRRFPPFLLDGQTVLVRDYLALRPERQDEITALLAQGRLQTGPWYVLADEQIPAGESLLRNLALGRRDLLLWGGTGPTIYSPDAFGHPAALPAIGGEFGLRTAVVWRGLSDRATDGRDLAWWTAPDGARVLLYHLPPAGYEIGSNLLVGEPQLLAAWRRLSAALLPRAATGHVAVFVGADHHAPDPRLSNLDDRLAALDPSVDFRFSSVAEFLAAAAAEAGDLAVLSGELRDSYGYCWTLQGVHGTRAPHKRRHSGLELELLRRAEPLVALARDPRAGSRIATLRQAWRELVQCQFHDAIGGCAVDPVAQALTSRMDDVAAAATELVRGALHSLAGHDPDAAREGAEAVPRLLVWNGAARPRGGVIVAEASFFHQDVLVGPPGGRQPRTGAGFTPFVLRRPGRPGVVAPQVLSLAPALERRDATRHYPDQDLVELVRFAVPLGESLSGLTLGGFEVEHNAAPVTEQFTAGRGTAIWNGRIEATLDRDGSFTLRDPAGQAAFAGLLALESARDLGDCYSHEPLRGDRVRRGTRTGKPRLVAAGPLVAGLEWGVKLTGGLDHHGRAGRVAAVMAIELLGDSPVVRCRVRLDNQASNHRLRLRLPTGLRGVPAMAGTQFGQVSRHPRPAPRGRHPMETPVTTAPAHRWVAVARRDRGLAVLAPGFFEYEWTRGGDLLVTLLRSVGELSRDDLTTRPGHAGWPVATPMAQCLGEDIIELGLALVSAADLAAPERMEELWEDTFVPPLAVWVRECTGTGVSDAGVELTGEGLVFSSCLPTEQGEGMVVRCYNPRETAVDGAWQFGRPIVRAQRVRADETVLEELVVAGGGRRVAFHAEGRAIVSVRVESALTPDA